MVKDVVTGTGELRLIPNQSSKGSLNDFGSIMSRIGNINWTNIGENSNYHNNTHIFNAVGVFVVSFGTQLANQVMNSVNDELMPQIQAHFNGLINWMRSRYGIHIECCVDSTISMTNGTVYAIFQLTVNHNSNKNIRSQVQESMDAIVASIAIGGDAHDHFECEQYNRYRRYDIGLAIEYVSVNSQYRNCIVPFTPIPVTV